MASVYKLLVILACWSCFLGTYFAVVGAGKLLNGPEHTILYITVTQSYHNKMHSMLLQINVEHVLIL